ncbi:MAG: FG-GAP-like repeat-containing protein [Bacteroidota bacterium]
MSASFGDDKVAWYENNGNESFITHIITTDANGARSVYAADIDGDGDVDVLSASIDDNTIAWYENDGNEVFTTRIITTEKTLARSVYAADIDGDMDMDVVSASATGNEITWYENDGNEVFTTRTVSSATSGAQYAYAADIDGDMDMDIASASDTDDRIAWYENSGSEVFEQNTLSTDADFAFSVYAADIDGDGDLDLLSASVLDDRIVWYDQGDVLTWDGSSNSDWTNANNWTPAQTPGAFNDVVIAASGSSPVISTGIQEIDDISIENNATLTIVSGAGLSIQGTAEASGTGSASISRNIVDDLGLSAVGSPVTDATIADLSADFPFAFFEPSNSYFDAMGTITLGQGIFIAYDSPNASVTFNGTPNSGTIFRNMTNTSGEGDGFNLVANPYTAPISRTEFLETNDNSVITGTIYLWNDGGSNVGANRGGDYVAVNNMGATKVTDTDNVDGPAFSFDENTPIGSMQGFYVQAIDANEVLTFNPDMQVATGNDDANFFRPNTSEQSLLKLALTNGKLYNELIVGLDVEATMEGNDFALDATKFAANEDFSFYSLIGDQAYAIQALPKEFIEPMEIPLGFSISKQDEFSIKVVSMENADEEIQVMLLDKVSGDLTEITADFELTFTAKEGTSNDRFSLIYLHRNVITDITNERLSGNLAIFKYNEGLLLKTDFSGSHKVSIYDLQGRVILEEDINFDSSGEAVINTKKSITDQLHILKVNNQTVKFILNK